MKFQDLTGNKYGRWTVICRDDNPGDRTTMWLCRCDCGNVKRVQGYNLKNGISKSCGCYKAEASRQRNTKRNDFYIEDDKAYIYLRNIDKYCVCDADDWDKLQSYTWFASSYDNNAYPITHITKNGKDELVLMHHMIMGKHKGLVIDHIDRNKMNNCKKNLRITTQQINTINRSISKRNKSGVTGVRLREDIMKWTAELMVNGVVHRLGCFENFDDAVLARKNAEERYFKPLIGEQS